MRRAPFLLLAAAGIAAGRDAAAHTCGRVPLSPFQLADRADEIAVVDGESGSVVVESVLKGAGAIWTALPEGERPRPDAAPAPPPPPPRPPGRGRRAPRVIVLEELGCRWDSLRDDVRFRVLAFATADGWSVHPAGASTVSLARGDEELAMIEAVRFWIAHRDLAERRRHLLDLARRPDRVGLWAALHFRAAPELLHGMTRAEAVELVAAIAARPPQNDTAVLGWLLETLARLHVPEALPVLVDAALSPQRASLDDFLPVHELAQRLAGGSLQEALGRSRDPADWTRWMAERSVATRRELLRAGFASMGVTGEVDPDDPTSLARVMRDGPSPAARVLALDLCEQAVGAPLRLDDPDLSRWLYPGAGSAFLDGEPYDGGTAGWAALADQCRSPERP